MPDKPRRCPPWCASTHDLGSLHESAHPDLGLGIYAAAVQRPGKRKMVLVSGVPVRDPFTAGVFARFLERLGNASPEVHRALAAQVRDAGVIAFGAEEMERFR